ncbi:MAG: Mur ligase family protein [Pseudomonadota bacterium]
MKLELDEVRRLTGPNLLWDKPGAIVDVFITDTDADAVAQCWQRWVHRLLDEFDWGQEESTYRLHADGANMAISAPMDALYTACEVAELAWDCAVAELLSLSEPDWQARLTELSSELADEVNPELLRLIAAANDQNVRWLSDDDDLSLGTGAGVKVWPVRELPSIDTIDWDSFTDIQSALITGTNGKSTSVRLAAEIAKAAGFNAGVTSTDFIRVGDDIIDRGDYSGPGGARMLLRDPRTQMAFLEVARGGILRRGLPVESVNAALVTNVASDHLGQYGINTVEELAEAKFVVAKALDAKSVLVVNADNELVVNQAPKTGKTLCWFSVNEANPLIQAQLQSGGRAVFVRSGKLIYHASGLFEEICAVNDVPMTFGGTAQHNIENALGVIGLCRCLKLPFSAIRQGLMSFSSDAEDNPGRGNVYQVDGRQVIVDFAHNEHSMRAVVDMVNRLPASQTITMFGHAGDRSDQDIADLTDAVAALDADLYIISELAAYLRGRELGDVPAVVEKRLREKNVKDEQIYVAKDPLSGAKHALSVSKPGDVILLFVLDQREQVHEWLSSQVTE